MSCGGTILCRGRLMHLIQVALLILLLLGTVCMPLIVVVASPIHPLPPHRGISRGSYIRHYGAAWYDTSALRQHRDRVRRDASDNLKDQPLTLRLHALDKMWTIKLVRDGGLFADDAIFENSDGIISFDTNRAYVGSILEDENASVQGVVTEEGLFDGTVWSGLEEYYIEPSSRYSVEDEDTSPPYHTIAYRASDVTSPSQPLRCASQHLSRGTLRESIDRVSRGANVNGSSEPLYEHLVDEEIRAHGGLYSNEPVPKKSVTSAERNYDLEYLDRVYRERYARHLHKRATVDPRKTTCMLYLQADHQFFSRYGTEEACIEVMTRHVQRVNSIYKHTDFNQDGRPDNISFMIKRVKVHSGESVKDPNYRFPGNYGVEKFLELFSEEDYDAFCLAYMFTYRDFEMGTLGLAWTGDLKNAGGVCEKNGHYRGSMKSLNTGIVTLLNYGKHVPPAVSHVTLAHEIGHNFGSPHDPEQCTPGGEDGNFIMFARATSGDKRNNNRFSPCSLNAINPVLNTKARSPKGCFTEPQASLCGNGVVEEGEECDCGWEEDCRDSCCFPQRRYPPAEEPPCRLTPGSICSPSQGPCCTNECKLQFGVKCRDDNGCRDASFCDGRVPHCPPSINKPNKTVCNEELVCFMGECTGSICLAYGLESCQCIPGPTDPPTKACELCCRLPGENQPCLSSFDWNKWPYDIPDMFSKPGTPCNDYNGYCDVFQKCREVDPSGPLATLRKLLLSDESLASFKRWVADHWYAVALIVLGAISLLVASTRLLGKRPDLKLKSVTIIHSSTTETVRLPPEGQGGVTVHPPAVRAKLPLSRKVREKRRRRRKVPNKNSSSGNGGAQGNEKPSKVSKKKRSVAPASSGLAGNLSTPGVLVQPSGTAEDHRNEPASNEAISAGVISRKRVAEVLLASGVVKQKKLSKEKQQHPQNPTSEANNNVNNTGAGATTTAIPIATVQAVTSNVNQKKRRKKGNKEVIDYSSAQQHNENDSTSMITDSDPKSKVRSWLLASSQVVTDEPSNIPKSKSTPAGLTTVGGMRSNVACGIRGRQVTLRRPTDPKARSLGSIARNNDHNKNDRLRLQVVYKPPFKFSVKLRKADKVGAACNVATATAGHGAQRTSAPRTGVLVRTTTGGGESKAKKGSFGNNANRITKHRSNAGKTANFTGLTRGTEDPSANSDLHTVPSDLEVLLSECEFLFSDA
ncbi:disintegrin and metalloproteinase domain-containing protein 10-like [Athalia rosae]|uniref:disintegrin and metalloproteinase domain-containing protein 10-like n=1 Tax=Athalia rosae TaxID=37344 RepID=UPI002033B416|nr:disintegrin and metalloproteinase domain-containing protein 10-like [Athalia rosae]